MDAADATPEAERGFNPFPGLRPFEPDEDHLFFGRERETDALLRRLRQTRFLAVLGTSGSGKSSLVRSGLIPSLYSGFMAGAGSSWRVAILRPGDDPIGNLAAALDAPDVLGTDGELAGTNRMLLDMTLRRSTLGLVDCMHHARLPTDENLLVVVDQFEELFRFKRRNAENAGDEAVAFVKLLLDASRQEELPVYVVITMRSDFIGDCMGYPGLPEAINRAQYLIPRMTRDELRAAITGPVAVAGGEIATRLVMRLLNEVGDDPDRLPVMQHALMRSWDRHREDATEGEPLDLRHYESIGTMREALSRHAEKAFAELRSERQREIAARMFRALTDTGMDGRGVRRPTPVGEVAAIAETSDSEVIEVAEHFRGPGRSFLMPPSGVTLQPGSVLDLSHESLMRCWPRLVEWVETERAAGRSYRRICRAAVRNERGEAGLWVEPELDLGLEWREKSRPNEAWGQRYHPAFQTAMRFLDRSREARDRRVADEERARSTKLRRTRWLAAVLGSTALVTLALGLFAQRAGQQAHAAERSAGREAETARQVSKFLVGLFEEVDPDSAQGREITAREILDHGAGKIESELATQPAVQAKLMGTMGQVYKSLGLYTAATPMLEGALRRQRELHGQENAVVAASLIELGDLLRLRADYPAAEGLFREALEMQRRLLGTNHALTARSLYGRARAREAAGDFLGARADFGAALQVREATLGPDDPEVAESLTGLAGLLSTMGDNEEARGLLERALAIRESQLGPDHPGLAESLDGLAGVLVELGDYDGARLLYDRALAIQENAYGPGHPRVANSLLEMFKLLSLQRDFAGALPLCERSLEIRRAAHGEEHPEFAAGLACQANLLAAAADFDAARPLLERALDIREKALGPDHPDVAGSLDDLGWLLLETGDFSRAKSLFERARAIREKAFGPGHPLVADSMQALVSIRKLAGDYQGARAGSERVLRILEASFGPDHPKVAGSLTALASYLRYIGEYDQARLLFERSMAIIEAAHGPGDVGVVLSVVGLGSLLRAAGEYDAARPLLERALEMVRDGAGPDHPATAYYMVELGILRVKTGDLAAARQLLERALEIREQKLGPEDFRVAQSLTELGTLLTETGEYEAARVMLDRSLSIQEMVVGPEHPDLSQTLNARADLAAATGDPAGARKLYRRALRIREASLGPDSPAVAETSQGLSNLLAVTGDPAGARSHCERALRIREAKLRPGHPDLAATVRACAALRD